MDRPPTSSTQDADNDIITPELIRGLSLGKVTEEYGTAGLYVRTLDTLERAGLGDNKLIQTSLELGLALHADDIRTNGHYTDHLMRVMLHIIEDFEITDPNIVAAAPVHDTLEDHAKDLVAELTGEPPTNPYIVRELGRYVLAGFTNNTVASLVETVTTPILRPGENKIEVYTLHTKNIVLHSPGGRVLKLGDFMDNAVGNHTTIGAKQRQLDEKYIRQYNTHRAGLYMPDSLITGEARRRALDLLSKGYTRALGRLASTDMID